MIETLTNFFITSALVLFGIAFIIGLFRLIKGPTTADRVVAFDASSAVIMCIIGMVSGIHDTVSILHLIMICGGISAASSLEL